MKWNKSSLTFYYFNSFIEVRKEKKKKIQIFIQKKNLKIIYLTLLNNSKNLVIITANDISEEEMFLEIVKKFLEMQISSSNETSQFNFNFDEFVKNCLEVPIQQSNL